MSLGNAIIKFLLYLLIIFDNCSAERAGIKQEFGIVVFNGPFEKIAARWAFNIPIRQEDVLLAVGANQIVERIVDLYEFGSFNEFSATVATFEW